MAAPDDPVTRRLALHRIVPANAGRCSSDACGGGRRACPTPNACRVSDPPPLPSGRKQLTRMELAALWAITLSSIAIAVGACSAAVAFFR